MAEKRKRVVAPFLTAGVLLLGLAAWAWHDYDRLNEFHQAEMRQFADGLYHSLKAQWDVMDPKPGWQVAGQRMVDGLLESTPQLMGVSIQVSSRLRLEAGLSPCLDCQDPTSEGERVTAEAYWFWRPLGGESALPGMDGSGVDVGYQEPGPAPPNLLGPAPSLGMHAVMGVSVPPVLSLALAKEMPEPFREAELKALLIRFSIALAAILALTVAWLQSIRSRSLASQLSLEQTRRAHLEELSLAAAGLAHETKNPLGIIRGIAQRISEDPSVEQRCRDSAERIVDAADQATGRLGEFISYARVRKPQLKPVDVTSVIARAVKVLEEDLLAARVTMDVQLEPTWALADEEMFLQILLNLMLNSIQASPTGGCICVRLETAQGKVTLKVIDQGKGIPGALLEEVFKPYVSTRQGGHGMGLTIVRRMAESQGWSIELHSEEGQGTTARIRGIELAARPEEG